MYKKTFGKRVAQYFGIFIIDTLKAYPEIFALKRHHIGMKLVSFVIYATAQNGLLKWDPETECYNTVGGSVSFLDFIHKILSKIFVG